MDISNLKMINTCLLQRFNKAGQRLSNIFVYKQIIYWFVNNKWSTFIWMHFNLPILFFHSLNNSSGT